MIQIRPFIFILLAFILFSCEKYNDYDPSQIGPFEGISPPESGKGYQIYIPPFPVPPHFEKEIFLRMPVGNDSEIYISSMESQSRPGSHHLLAYGYKNESDPNNPEIGVMRIQNLNDGRGNLNTNMREESIYYFSQSPNNIIQFPKGTAIKLRKNATFDINTHYYNITDATKYGEAYINIYTIPKDSVLETLVLAEIDNKENLVLPKNSTTVIEKTEIFNQTTSIRVMTGHMHKRGVQFDVFIVGGPNDGDLVYTSYDYQHSPTLTFDPAIILQKGEGLKSQVKYANNTNKEIRYGVTSEDEMGKLFYFKSEL